ncbi:sodium:dicarboxylate symporter [Halothiobacillus diazotrophicus]|uniref:Sodium:dicarboxylate symporter n=1 Tax=Halothiobacillus diazotrophicus TaxID=1860122 RepID=A0A191ZJ78_9GAMM|nr:dicarboxylate/amino acid:cation symporter [Halothiobacillus diazotrophicus]ANJ67956.1 sodium:dicarboxylate symporter [Halothiobacillus diazotrophicus]
MALHWQILIAIGAAFVFGSLFGAGVAGVPLLSIYEFVGGMFLDALKMLIVPLIVSSIISGAANLGQGRGVVAIARRTITYFLASTTLAIVTALVVMNVIHPGVSGTQPLGEVVHLPSLGGDVADKFSSHQFSDFVQVLRDMVPPNIVNAAAHTQMLGLIVFSLLFGFALTRVPEPSRQVVHDFWNGVQEVMIQITHWLMKLAPIGVFALVAAVVAKSGLALLLPMLGFFLTVVLGLAIHAFVTLPLILWLTTRLNPVRFVRAVWPAMLMAFSTSSSAGTLPVTMDVVENRAGVSKEIASFVLPLGATINMNGTALYECAAALFIAQAYGVDLSIWMQLMIVVLALMTSIGVAAVPSASLVAIALILGVLGLPLEAMGLLLVVDRVLDMLRTSVNVYSDSVGAVIVAHRRGDRGLLT